MDGSNPEPDGGPVGADYSDRLSDLIVSMIRLMGKTHMAIVIGAFVMGSAVLLSSWSNGRAIAAGDDKVESRLAEIEARLTATKCHCDLRTVRADASGNQITILPDPNSEGQLRREMLTKLGYVNAGLRSPATAIGDGSERAVDLGERGPAVENDDQESEAGQPQRGPNGAEQRAGRSE